MDLPQPPRPRRPNWGFLRLCALTFAAVLALAHAQAAELVMFEREGCPWCAAFDREIGAVYPKTEEGARAPLRRVDIARGLPKDLGGIAVERFTPVFVLVQDGREVGRIRGYPGQDHFWGLLGMLIARLDPPGTQSADARPARN